MRFEVKVGAFGGFFKGNNVSKVVLQSDAVTIIPDATVGSSSKFVPDDWIAGREKYNLSDISYCLPRHGTIWGEITLATKSGTHISIKGVTNDNADEFCRRYSTQKDIFDRSKSIEKIIGDLLTIQKESEHLFSRDTYIREDEFRNLRSRIPNLAVSGEIDASLMSTSTWNAISAFRKAFSTLDDRFKDHNNRILLRDNALRLLGDLSLISACVRRCSYFFSTDNRIEQQDVEDLRSALQPFTSVPFDATVAGEDLCQAIEHLRDFLVTLGARVEAHNHGWQLQQNHDVVHGRAEWLLGHARYLDDLGAGGSYVRRLAVAQFAEGLVSADEFWKLDLPADKSDGVCSAYKSLRGFLGDPERWRRSRNLDFVERELAATAHLFRAISANLTLEQRTAAIVDENALRLIAGAGTGKTTTLLAKAAYLTQRQNVAPSKILAITYSKKSRKDLEARFDGYCPDVPTSTIHALGYTIVGLALSKKPSLAPWIEDDAAFTERAERYIANVFSDSSLLKHAAYFILLNEMEAKPGYAFDSIAQYQDYVLRVKPISLKGERLRSVQEVLIANFLYLHGVEYKYERPYVIDTADPQHARYRPDFFLPRHNIYIEHYGVDRGGKTAPDVNAAEYAAHMAWKRETHAKYETDCIETFSYQAAEGTLIENLRDALAAKGVPLDLIDGKDILVKLRERGKVTQLAALLLRVIPLWKERNPSITSLMQVYAQNEFFREHGIPVLERLIRLYEQDLVDTGYVDYSDMVVQAQSLIEECRAECPYDVVMLDEAQDLSWARAHLVRSYVLSAPDVRFTAVGDDWQSIYRFAGSQLDTFVDFDQWFGRESVTLHLTETHRFNEAIEKPTTSFVSRNPRQTQRSLKSVAANEPALHFLSFEFDRGDQPTVALQELAWRYVLDGRSVLFVYRTTYDAPQDLRALQRQYPKTKISGVTAHSSKGLEADFVVVLEANASWTGFPTVRPAEPIIEPLLPPAEPFDHAEDRRLFYVACTRGKIAAVICFRQEIGAPFVDEMFIAAPLATMTYFGDVGARHAYVPCRSCGIGRYEVKTVDDRTFIGCSQFPACRETSPPCPTCKGIVATDDSNAYYCCECGADIGDGCPRCKRGWLVKKSGRRGEFWGCSRWRMDRMGCDYTRSIESNELIAG